MDDDKRAKAARIGAIREWMDNQPWHAAAMANARIGLAVLVHTPRLTAPIPSECIRPDRMAKGERSIQFVPHGSRGLVCVTECDCPHGVWHMIVGPVLTDAQIRQATQEQAMYQHLYRGPVTPEA